MAIKINDTYLSEIANFGMDGEGVAIVDGLPVFVPYAATGDLCKIKIEKVNKRFATAKLVKVVKPSPLRETPKCTAYGMCGGCCLQHITFAAENEYKRDFLKNTLKKAGLVVDVEDTVFDTSYAYRNKLQMPFAEIDDKITVGFFQKGTHSVVPLTQCPLHGDWATKLISIVNFWANGGAGAVKQSVYDEITKKGLLRHLVARYVDGFLSVVLVINGRTLPSADVLYSILQGEFRCGLYVSENRAATNVIMTDSARLLFGGERELVINGVMLTLSPNSFLQVNDAIREKLYAEVCAEVTQTDVIFDVYSGVGIMTAMLSRAVPKAKVYGIEIVRQAVINADGLMWANGLDRNVKNICGDAAEVLPEMVKTILDDDNSKDKPNITVVIDPPRKGCDERVLAAIVEAEADKVIYVSCNPATLSRDLKGLSGLYDIKRIAPFNMFPRTAELETLAVLTKKKTDK